MSKSKIIIISIIGLIIVLNTVLFGAVFRLRKQTVTVVGEDFAYTTDAIIETAGLKNGKSIFLLNKDEATNKIETTYPDLKVIQIKTTSVTEIEIRVRKRYETYYYKNLGLYYVLDEDLKILSIKDESTEVEHLTKITSEINDLNESSKVTNFVGNQAQINMCYNLYTAVYSTQMTDEIGELAHTQFCSLIESISFDVGYTASGQTYNRLIVETPQGMTFDIGKADNDLQRKINICFATLNDEDVLDKTGKVTISYSDGEEQITYTNGAQA